MSARLQPEPKAAPALAPTPKPSFTPVQGGLLERKCACGGSQGLAGDCQECGKKPLTLQRYSTDRAKPSNLLRSLAGASNPPSGATVEAGPRHDVRSVQVHTRAPHGIQTKRAVSQPGEQYEREADRIAEQVTRSSLLSGSKATPHSTVLSQTPLLIQRQAVDEVADTPEAEPAPASGVAETAAPGGAAAAGLILEDEAQESGPGRMRKSEFLDALRAAVCVAADAELAAVGRNTEGCPYIERWIGYYRTRSGPYVERTMRRYAPETAGVTRALDYIPVVSERVRRAVAVWARTGQITGVPEGASAAPPEAGGSEGSEATSAATGNIQFKERAGEAKSTDDPAAVRAQLGGGRPLDTGVRSRMESAFAYDFSRVRIHTDPKAAGITSGLNARAFAVGSDVAFAAGEYQPDTLIGDALLAHELAHVVQQGDGSDSVGPMQTRDANYDALEGDADKSAISAMGSLWGGAKGAAARIALNARPSLNSRLGLQRCSAGGTITTVAAPSDFVFNTVVPKSGPGPGGWKVACYEAPFVSYADPVSNLEKWRVECKVEVGVPLENHLGPVSDSLAQQEAYLSSVLAAQAVLGSTGSLPVRPPKAIFCVAFQKAMEAALVIAVPGAKVSNFGKYCK